MRWKIRWLGLPVRIRARVQLQPTVLTRVYRSGTAIDIDSDTDDQPYRPVPEFKLSSRIRAVGDRLGRLIERPLFRGRRQPVFCVFFRYPLHPSWFFPPSCPGLSFLRDLILYLHISLVAYTHLPLPTSSTAYPALSTLTDSSEHTTLPTFLLVPFHMVPHIYSRLLASSVTLSK